ncbi:hypothetical protein BJY01DRAFT_243067 [Aspergillus pseudoustus]|uniref:Uncharacterized protein n=1 Tax=Aspergillus pseudoustus TaxID=1810923 RepID=A0ABR4KUF2_9EURO
MHWSTTLPHLLLFLLTQSTSALQTSRITTTFTPTCPDPATNPGDLELNESFSTSLTIRSGICQPVPVPLALPYISEVDHVFVSASRVQGQQAGVLKGPRRQWEWQSRREGGEEETCVVRLWEVPGCFGTPLVEAEISRSSDGLEQKSECRERKFAALNEVFVRVDCMRAEREKAGYFVTERAAEEVVPLDGLK